MTTIFEISAFISQANPEELMNIRELITHKFKQLDESTSSPFSFEAWGLSDSTVSIDSSSHIPFNLTADIPDGAEFEDWEELADLILKNEAKITMEVIDVKVETSIYSVETVETSVFPPTFFIPFQSFLPLPSESSLPTSPTHKKKNRRRKKNKGWISTQKVSKKASKRATQEKKELKNTTLILKSLPFYETCDEELMDIFSYYGDVKYINVLRTDEGRGKGIAFVSYHLREDSDRALAFDNMMYRGRTIFVEYAEQRK